MPARLRARWFLLFFFLSGLSSLICEVVWLRLAMASFGVTTATVSIVLSVFMGGLALGSWTAGRISSPQRRRNTSTLLRFYATAEFLIALSAIAVPFLLRSGQTVLSQFGAGIEWASISYYLGSLVCITLALIPFSAAMGATFPLAMGSIRLAAADQSKRSFSYLYAANVFGAATGTILSALFLIELIGFQRTLLVAAALNVLIAVAALGLSFAAGRTRAEAATHEAAGSRSGIDLPTSYALLALLFLTGLTSMALEVVWVRQFTPFLGTVVYAFAAILTIYLLATFLGSVLYRIWSSSPERGVSRAWTGVFWFATATFALLALVATDPRLGVERIPVIHAMSFVRIVLGIAPFCATVGFLTPALVDRWSFGNPRRAGSAYAINVIGCIVGPLVASFVLLPWLSERWTLVIASAVLAVVGLIIAFSRASGDSLGIWRRPAAIIVILVLAAGFGSIVKFTHDFESNFPKAVVKRDTTATVIATGQGRTKELLVNGFGVTALITITKTVAHLPLASLDRPPQNALVVCFGMGTSFRSATTWGIAVTAVELIPAVPGLFGYYHDDAAEVLQRPDAKIVIDDGRRFLARTRETYDVITIDPPPPPEGAGTSLLYSREFYTAARAHLRHGGILQQWFPATLESKVVSAVARSLKESFPYVRAFGNYQVWGVHFLASDEPIPVLGPDDLAAKMPPAAAKDIVEWEVGYIPAGIFTVLLGSEVSVDSLIGLDPSAPTLTDDRPVNEYYFMRRGMSFKLITVEILNRLQKEKRR